MPVFLTRRNPHHISWPDFLDGITPALHPARASRHDQGLTERTRMPCRPGTGLGGDVGSIRTVPLRYSAGPWPEGCEPFRRRFIVKPPCPIEAVACLFTAMRRM